jgi:hypothetical protein
VPKCGTSFGLAILNYACPQLGPIAFPRPKDGDTGLAAKSLMDSLMKRYPPPPPMYLYIASQYNLLQSL